MQLEFLMGYDGPIRMWLNGELFFDDLEETKPAIPDQSAKTAVLPAGPSTITIGMDTNGGRAEGFFLRFRRKDISSDSRRTGGYAAPRYTAAL